MKTSFEQKYIPLIEKIDLLQEFLGSAVQKINDRTMTKQEYKRLQNELRMNR